MQKTAQVNGLITYQKWGDKPHFLFALHGFGEESSTFEPLLPVLTSFFTVIAPDLPFHGNTCWASDKFDVTDLQKMTQIILQDESLETLSILGFSMGGGIALRLFAENPKVFQKIILLAPDGISSEPIYNFFTALPTFLKKGIIHILNQTEQLQRVADFLYRFRCINAVQRRFVQRELLTKDEKRRNRLFFYWVQSSNFRCKTEHWQTIRRNGASKITVFLGTKDTIVPLKARKILTQKIKTLKVVEVPFGHQMMQNSDFAKVLQRHLSPNH